MKRLQTSWQRGNNTKKNRKDGTHLTDLKLQVLTILAKASALPDRVYILNDTGSYLSSHGRPSRITFSVIGETYKQNDTIKV